LAIEWTRHHGDSLESFAAHVEAELRARRAEIPPRAHPFLDFLLRTNLLVSYREPGGIARALEGLSRRVGRENPLGTGMAAIEAVAPDLAGDFRDFFPGAVALATAERAARSPGGA
jgi:acyl carrier protein phosphodiesterase